jgi:hypothetical protein
MNFVRNVLRRKMTENDLYHEYDNKLKQIRDYVEELKQNAIKSGTWEDSMKYLSAVTTLQSYLEELHYLETSGNCTKDSHEVQSLSSCEP